VQSGQVRDAAYSFPSRFEDGSGTNPEELLGAAHAACFAMAFSNELAKAGHAPARVSAEAQVTLSTDGGAHIAGIALACEAEVPGIDAETFATIADQAKQGCPISKALASVPITLEARLVG
jgi:osmotically inducible protein OsmC